ncbi:DUF6113 family protein [Streptomyces lavendofoliae]|uniref:Integral membrane protein n=1 Tax=Streptomyces lavendofoliae TaxID=67314 RepID=A0A918M3X2_9ACTN|nr:DUF6113 family protein [Streptomyces lavendofoliae]GGU37284.1 hypothetical protein GCM10010274_26020 [Streptomyces lavendofoliae]
MSRGARIAAYTGLAVLGAVTGVAGALVQGAWFPGGLLLALAACGGLFYGGLRATGTQAGVMAPGAGWLVAVVLLSLGRPEGDQVFWGGLAELVYLIGGMAAAVMCATIPRLPHQGGRSGALGA